MPKLLCEGVVVVLLMMVTQQNRTCHNPTKLEFI